jgi:hypothetical protein
LPDSLTAGQQETLAGLEGACPEITAVAGLIRSFATLLAPDSGNNTRLIQWMTDACAADLPHVHSFTRGLDLDTQTARAALTMPYHNGRTEGVNTKMIKGRCTAAQDSSSSATGSCWADTIRNHRKYDRAAAGTVPSSPPKVRQTGS